MARGYNHVCLVGNVTRDPEIKAMNDDKTVVNFTVAVGYSDKEVGFFSCVAFDKLADIIHRFVKKGTQILVDGRLKQEKWTDKEGREQHSTKIIVSNMKMMSPKAEEKTDKYGQESPF